MTMSVLKVIGGKPLRGTVSVGGSKNAALAILASVPVVTGEIKLTNVPDISDVHIKLSLLQQFGIKAEFDNGTVHIDTREIRPLSQDLSDEDVRKIRTGFYMLGPLVARLGKVVLPGPGGCSIGNRPVDYHIKGLERLGATVKENPREYVAEAKNLQGGEIYLDSPSAGATQHLMATACLVPGCTIIQNASMEPEVVTLASFLRSAGAKIEGEGTNTITITGVSELHSCEARVPHDRIQAGTYLIAAAATRGDITVTGILPVEQTALVNKLIEAGFNVEEGSESVRVWGDVRSEEIKVTTMPYPGFPTDLQQPMTALLTLGKGVSQIKETIYESRVGHLEELRHMGARITLEGRTSLIIGVEGLTGADVRASDLRGGAALVIAALAAQGESTIRNVHYIDRGYQDLENNIRALGGQIERVPDTSSHEHIN